MNRWTNGWLQASKEVFDMYEEVGGRVGGYIDMLAVSYRYISRRGEGSGSSDVFNMNPSSTRSSFFEV